MALRYEIRLGQKHTLRLKYTSARGSQNRFRISAPVHLNNSKNWLSKDQKIRVCKEEGVDTAKRNNTVLYNFKAHYLNEIEKLEKEDIQLTKELFSYIALTFGGKTIQKENLERKFDYSSLLSKWINKAEAGQLLQDKGKNKGYQFSSGTIKNYKSILGHIQAFEKEYGGIKPQQVNKKLYNNILVYLRECKEDYADGNLGAVIKNFKATIPKIKDEYNISFPDYDSREWSVLSPNALKIALNLEEVMDMYNLDLSEHVNRYDIVRDAYVFNALSCGARIGDYKKFNHTNLKKRQGKTYLEYVQEKTGKFIIAPLPPICLSIIKKHNGFPEIGTAQDSNRKLKELGKLCAFEEIQYLRDSKGKVIASGAKWELLTNHTSRRSFCTIAYLNGMDTINIRSISGHGGETILLEYINITQQQHAINIQKTEHFKKVSAINTLRTA